jgi:Ca2+/Na+ antiporter
MACRRVVCGECATEWDGINYCAACLAARRREVVRRTNFLGFVAMLLATALLFIVASRLAVWLGVLVVSL